MRGFQRRVRDAFHGAVGVFEGGRAVLNTRRAWPTLTRAVAASDCLFDHGSVTKQFRVGVMFCGRAGRSRWRIAAKVLPEGTYTGVTMVMC